MISKRVLIIAALAVVPLLGQKEAGAGSVSAGCAASKSVATLCAEHDNVNIPLMGSVSSFVVEATHPAYVVDTVSCPEDWRNCPASTDPSYPFSPGGTFPLFDDHETLVEAVRETSWWQPNGMTASVEGGAAMEQVHYIRLSRKIVDSGEFPQFLVIYEDGYMRLIPQPPAGVAKVCFGASVVIGPAPPADRPFAAIASIKYLPASRSLQINYRAGGSATIDILELSRQIARVSVTVNYPVTNATFGTFRSMYVASGNADTDAVRWIDASGAVHDDPIMGFSGGAGTEWFFYRRGASGHSPSGPDIRVRVTASSPQVFPCCVVDAGLFGLDFSPYLNGQDPNLGTHVATQQIMNRMQTVAPYTKWVRTFSSSNGLEYAASVAHQLGLKVAAGAWIGGNLAQNDVEIANLIQAANAGQVDVAIVGSEALLRNDVSESQLVSYMRQVRQAIPQTIPVTTADTYGTLLAHQPVIDASDIVFGNFYPYWEGISIDTAMISLVQRYERLVAAAGNRRVVVSETGWPSAGNAVGAAIPSPANAAEYLSQFASWASSNNIPCFYFEAFDEDWKAAQEGPQGAHWGLWDASGVVKPGMQGVLGARASLDGVIGGPGAPALSFTYVPPYGSSDALEGQALHINPGSYGVAVYINAAGGWWSKPTFEQPVTQIEADGSWSARIVTGGVDQNASAISAFLIPAGFTPPALSGEPNLPPSLIANSVAQAQAQRSLASISGTVTDALGRSISGVTIGGGDLGTTTTAPDGKYSFYYVATVGSVSLTPSYPNFLFTPPSANINITGGSQIANFIGVARVDLSLTSSLSADPVTVGSSFTATVVVSNAGIGAASGAIVLMPLPSSFAVLSATTTRGSCTTAGTLVRCDVGPLAPTAYTTITVVIRPSVTGSFAVSASVSGPDSDSNAANDSTTQGITITPAASVMVQAWNAWVTAGKNDPSDRASAVWGSKFVVSYLDDGSVAAPTSCQVATFDKTGAALEYQVYDSVTSVRTPSFGTPAGLAPGWTSQFRLSSPLGDSAPFIGGPARITCYSTDPDALRTRVIVSRLFSLYDAGGKKLGEVSDQMNWTPSWRFSLPLMEGVEGGVNLANNGLAIFNAASADEAANPVTVRICLRDSSGNQGPCRDLTLNPATQNRVGETKVVVLSTLFGSDLYFPYPSGAQRGDSIYGTLTVESLGRTRIAVAGSLLTNGTTLTGVPSIPISTQ